MDMKKLILCFFTSFLLLLPTNAFADTSLPIEPKKQQEIKPVDNDELFGSFLSGSGTIAAEIYKWGIDIVTILFIIGTLTMILSIIFKNGQWQKYSQGTMFISFTTMLVLRGLPIIVLSIKSSEDFSHLLNHVINSISSAAVFLGMISISLSFLFRYGNRLIEHPDFHRWSKNLLSVAILMIVFSMIVPILFPII